MTELMEKLPKGEKKRIEQEERRGERLELKEMQQNLWKTWRGAKKNLKERIKIPREDAKLE